MRVVCHLEKLDSGSSCGSDCYQPDGRSIPSVKLTCGRAGGKTSETEWAFLRQEGKFDVYRFTYRFPVGEPDARAEVAEVRFAGDRVKVFENRFQCVVAEGPPQP